MSFSPPSTSYWLLFTAGVMLAERERLGKSVEFIDFEQLD